jgi:hypothetical protein
MRSGTDKIAVTVELPAKVAMQFGADPPAFARRRQHGNFVVALERFAQ